MEGGKSQNPLLADVELIDVGRLDSRLDAQGLMVRHDQHELLAGGDHASDRVHPQFVHDAVYRRSDVRATKLVFCGDLAVPQLRDLCLNLPDLFLGFRGCGLVYGPDLQLNLGDLSPQTGDIRYQRAVLAVDACLVALEADQARPAWSRC